MSKPTPKELEQLVKSLPSVSPTIPRKEDGSIQFEKLNTKMFFIIIIPLLLVGVGLFLVAALGYTPGVSYRGVAFNRATNQCAAYRYASLQHRSGTPLPRPTGWVVSAEIYFPDSPEEEQITDLETPYGWCDLRKPQECCAQANMQYVPQTLVGKVFQ